MSLEKLLRESTSLLHELRTPYGFLASTVAADNYKRVWARDSVICGIAGILLEDEILLEGLRNSLISLSNKQHDLGMIPSNVMPSSNVDVSYGSLVGRVDATTWFVVGSCLYYLNTGDEKSWQHLEPAILRARRFLKSIEFNDKGWIYTPLSGNWADEYPIHGYTLYDNALRIWGESLWQNINGETDLKLEELKTRTAENFWPSTESSRSKIYQKHAFNVGLESHPQHFAAFILPGKYDMRFDAAANALMLLQTRLSNTQKEAIRQFLDALQNDLNSEMIPAFWPVINKDSPDWELLSGNYSYDFKNKPGYFHNGGIWPVWMGLFTLGLSLNGMLKEVEKIGRCFKEFTDKQSNWDFQEYINSVDFELDGKKKMGYTASGIVFMHLASQPTLIKEKLHIKDFF